MTRLYPSPLGMGRLYTVPDAAVDVISSGLPAAFAGATRLVWNRVFRELERRYHWAYR